MEWARTHSLFKPTKQRRGAERLKLSPLTMKHRWPPLVLIKERLEEEATTTLERVISLSFERDP